MKLKRYINFISENLKEDIEELKLWKVDEEEIRDALVDLTDAGYLVTVMFGFVEDHKYYDYTTKSYKQKDVYTEKALAGENIRPAYWIQIEQGRKISNEDVSDSIQFTTDVLKSRANTDISVYDRDGNLGNTEGIVVKGGLFYTDDWNSGEPEVLSVNDYVAIFAKQKDGVKITQHDLVEYYGWDIAVEVDGKIWAEIDIEDLSEGLLSKRSSYRDILVKGEEVMWDYYEIGYYEPEINSLFSYTLERETKELLAKALIKEYGGFEKVKQWEQNSPPSSKGGFPADFKTEEELVSHFVNERNNELLKKWIKTEFADSEVYREVTNTIADWEQSAHLQENYKEIIDEFDEIVEKELGQFKKIEKEVTKFYYHNNERKEYKSEVTYYQFPYTNDWIEQLGSEDLFGRNLNSLFKEWLAELGNTYELDPRLSDYGNCDDKKMNEDIRRYLSRYLSK